MTRILPCLWFVDEAEEAARLYTALVPDSRVDAVVPSPADTPGPKAGSVVTVDFTLAGQPMIALNGGEKMGGSFALSLMIEVETQAEIDRVWDGFLAQGGKESQCGWIADPWGHWWQVTPRIMNRLLGDPDRARARRAMEAMFTMRRFDIAALERAAAG